jgi:hypothetical protein
MCVFVCVPFVCTYPLEVSQRLFIIVDAGFEQGNIVQQ